MNSQTVKNYNTVYYTRQTASDMRPYWEGAPHDGLSVVLLEDLHGNGFIKFHAKDYEDGDVLTITQTWTVTKGQDDG